MNSLCASTYTRELLSRKWLKLNIKVNNFLSGFNFWIAPHTERERETEIKHTFYSLISHLTLKFLVYKIVLMTGIFYPPTTHTHNIIIDG